MKTTNTPDTRPTFWRAYTMLLKHPLYLGQF